MTNKPIIILTGDPQSIFFEIFFKSLKLNNFKNPLILISSLKILEFHMKKNRFKRNIRSINLNNLKNNKLDNKVINLINVDYYNNIKSKKKIDQTSNYLKRCFDTAFKILKMGVTNKFINGPINKSNFK